MSIIVDDFNISIRCFQLYLHNIESWSKTTFLKVSNVKNRIY